MKYILLFILILPLITLASLNDPMPFPVFLKYGFSSILEFEEPPIRLVLGDPQNFQIEKLERSIAIKALASEAVSNMFVYFKTIPPKLFILKASDDAEPSYYKKFETLVRPKPEKLTGGIQTTKIVSAKFDEKKDYLIIEIIVFAKLSRLKPEWTKAWLNSGSKVISPGKVWSERRDVQKDSHVKARFIFYRPDVQKNLSDTSLVLPLIGSAKPIEFKIGGR